MNNLRLPISFWANGYLLFKGCSATSLVICIGRTKGILHKNKKVTSAKQSLKKSIDL